MKITFDILKVILPAITTGLFTFIITKYTYDKNRPLDKLEIAYNRVYYPIYKIISDKNLSMEAGIDKINIYLLKYNKYADISTTRIFMSLYECKKETKKKLIYQNFKNNIFSKNSYLRRRLGYLESNFVEQYKYFMPSLKSLIRILLETYILYFVAVLNNIASNYNKIKFINALNYVFLFFLLLLIWEIMWCLIRTLYYKIRK